MVSPSVITALIVQRKRIVSSDTSVAHIFNLFAFTQQQTMHFFLEILFPSTPVSCTAQHHLSPGLKFTILSYIIVQKYLKSIAGNLLPWIQFHEARAQPEWQSIPSTNRKVVCSTPLGALGIFFEVCLCHSLNNIIFHNLFLDCMDLPESTRNPGNVWLSFTVLMLLLLLILFETIRTRKQQRV